LVKRLFEMEVPEILSGIVEIKSIAREAGERTKISVFSNQDGVDPVGSCVGQRGVRVQAVMSEIGEEKIDIILWNEDPKIYIANALSPAKVSEIKTDEEEKKASVTVAEDQLSLAIGRQGQNVRLAAKLTGWNVDIQGGDEAGIEAAAMMMPPVEDKRDLEGEILKAVESNKSVQEEPDSTPKEQTAKPAPEEMTEQPKESQEEPTDETEKINEETEMVEAPKEDTGAEKKEEIPDTSPLIHDNKTEVTDDDEASHPLDDIEQVIEEDKEQLPK
jgi:N utilization substance protein A